MASIRQSIRSSTASKRPTSAIADGQIALNTASGTPGMFFKDNAGNIIKAGPAHYGATAPNSSPAVGGSTGNSLGEAWLDSSLTPAGWKVWNGAAWVNATPLSSDTVKGLVELATNAETQAGVDSARAVTAASLQSKVSDSVSTASASGIASSAAVKTAYDLANAALPKSGGIITGNLEIGTTGSLTFEGSTADGFETTLAVVDPTLDRTITFPNITGTVVTTGDTGTVTGTMIADNTIVNAEINASAAIAGTKISPNFGSQNIQTSGTLTVASGVFNLGTAAAPSITISGDLNTGIYSPGADQLAIATAGTGRVFVDSSGRLGIGTVSPSEKLTINSGNIQLETTTTTGADLRLKFKPGFSGTYGNQYIAAINAELRIGSSTVGGSNAVTGFYGSAGTEVARIDSSGRLLVGGSSDSGGALLQVFGDRIRIGTAKTPASTSATGTTGEISWDANYIYVCTATNTWKRTAISTW